MRYKKYLPYFVFVFFVALLSMSCKRAGDKITTDPSATLTFSQSTLTFDTIFTTVGSITKRLWVYNDNKHAVVISSIELAGQNNSAYKIIVNGDEVVKMVDFEVKGMDSLQILVSVLIDPQNQALPFLVEDSIVFVTNGNIQDVDLVAYGQDAEFISNLTLDGGAVWTNIKPYVLSGTVTVPAGCTLTIDKGTRVLFHSAASLKVEGTLLTLGEKDSIVRFKQDKLLKFYEDLPGQWEGISIQPGSKNNRFLYTEIKNAVNGITMSSENDGDTVAELTLENAIVKNCSMNGILAYHTDIYAVNSLFANCIGHLVKTNAGGNFYFDYCTFVNFSYDFFRDAPCIRLSNNEAAEANALEAKFQNTIVWGDKAEEVTLNNNNSSGFSFIADNSLLKSGLTISGLNNLINQDPLFESEFGKNYKLKDSSPAIDVGLTLPLITIDLEGITRDATPDMGCYEFE